MLCSNLKLASELLGQKKYLQIIPDFYLNETVSKESTLVKKWFSGKSSSVTHKLRLDFNSAYSLPKLIVCRLSKTKLKKGIFVRPDIR